jgi:hypothetical protein
VSSTLSITQRRTLEPEVRHCKNLERFTTYSLDCGNRNPHMGHLLFSGTARSGIDMPSGVQLSAIVPGTFPLALYLLPGTVVLNKGQEIELNIKHPIVGGD